MSKIIIYPYKNNIAIITPIEGINIPIEEIALKDVPFDVPFLIIEDSDLPDMTFRNAFEVDFSTPHGKGGDWGVGSSNEVIGYSENGEALIFRNNGVIINRLRTKESIKNDSENINNFCKEFPTKPIINLSKAIEVTQDLRRISREKEFKPLDEQISYNIPGIDITLVETQRQVIRDKYEEIQILIDGCKTSEELKRIIEDYNLL